MIDKLSLTAHNQNKPGKERPMTVFNMHERHFIEDIGLFFEQMGLPRMGGRILGVLLISDPAVQSLTELAEALQASKSAISSATRLLLEAELIERVPGPAARQEYYRFRNGSWVTFMRQRLEVMTDLHQITERGLELIKDKPVALRERLMEAHDLFSFMETEYAGWSQRFEAIQSKLRGARSDPSSE
jgi:DNA-binding transcriptional regulator GbsR (MarR family)